MRSFSVILILTALFATQVFSQSDSTTDPLLGQYVLANSAEAVILLTPSGTSLTQPWIVDWPTNASTITAAFPIGSDTIASSSPDAVAADLTGDGYDEVVTAFAGPSGTLQLNVRSANHGAAWSWGAPVTYAFGADTVSAGPRIVRGRFRNTAANQVLVAYISPSRSLNMVIFTFDAGRVPTRQSTIRVAQLASTLGSQQEFDIATGDFDRDRLDEIVAAWTIPNAAANEPNDCRLALFDVDGNSASMIHRSDTTLTLGALGQGTIAWRKHFALSAGDYNNDGYDEFVLSFAQGFWKTLLISEEIDYRILPFAPNPLLTSFHPTLGVAGFVAGQWTSSSEPTVPSTPGGSSIISADVDGDGYAEIVMAGLGAVKVFKAPSWPAFTLNATGSFAPTKNGPSHGLLAVIDVDGDTTQASWNSEIIIADYVSGSFLSTATGNAEIKTLGLTVDRSVYPYVTTAVQQVSQQTLSNSASASLLVAAGDFDGDAISVRSPKHLTSESFVQPLVILNVPPTHFDVVGGTVYDVCKINSGNAEAFKATYVKSTSTTSEFSSETQSDYTMSASVSAKFFDMFGLSFSAKRSKSFLSSNGSSESLTITSSNETHGDDYVFTSTSTDQYWDYPLYVRGVHIGNTLVVIPGAPSLGWCPRKDPSVYRVDQSHEVGNVLSYMKSPSAVGAFEVDAMVCNSFDAYTASDKAGKLWEVTLASSKDTNQQWTNSTELSVGASFSGWGIDASFDASYSTKSVTTHHNTATRSMTISLNVGSPDATLGNADYRITPMIYWANSGALVVDYAVEPTVWAYPDTSLKTWWQKMYGTASDPAFILPWRLDAEKNGSTSSPGLKSLTKSIRLSPSTAKPGDTVYIAVRVHNFSIVPTPGPVTVRLSVGDPDSGGVPIVGVNGTTELTSSRPIGARDFEILYTRWVVTGPGLSSTTRVYGVIDPLNTISEIHKENNKGWTILTVLGATAVNEQSHPAMTKEYVLYQNFPNPFNPKTVIRYSVPERTMVTLTVYDLLGREVSVLARNVQEPGTHTVWFDGSHIATGVYFYTLRAGGHQETRKLLLLK